jgi:hypothetical protein
MDRIEAETGMGMASPGIMPLAPVLKAAFEATVCQPALGIGPLARELGLATDDATTLSGADWQALGRQAAMATGDSPALLWFPVLFARVAFVDPEALIPVLDGLCDGWLAARTAAGLCPAGPQLAHNPALHAEAAQLLAYAGAWPDGLAARFWEVVEDVPGASAPGVITARCAAFGSSFSPAFFARLDQAVLRHPGLPRAVAAGPRPRIRMAELEGHAPGTLGAHLHAMVVDNGFDLEVIDTDAVAYLADTLPALHFTSRRILQTHDIWHVVGDFRLSGLGEVAISSFQLAQFGQNYSAGFLASVLALTAFQSPAILPYLIQVIAEGWCHGRTTPPLMPVVWEEMWDVPLDEVRTRTGCAPFRSAVPDA